MRQVKNEWMKTKMKIKGIKKVCSETKRIPYGYHLQIMYDVVNNEMFCSDLLNDDWHTNYKDPCIRKICDAYRYMSMNELYEMFASIYDPEYNEEI